VIAADTLSSGVKIVSRDGVAEAKRRDWLLAASVAHSTSEG